MDTIEAVLAAAAAGQAELVVPSHANRRGHPWLVERRLWGDLLDVKSPATLRDFLADHQKLIQMVQDGAPQADIMKKFGYGTSTQLKVAYANALIQSGQAPAIMGGRGGAKAKKEVKEVKVGKRGSIIIPAEMVV